MVQQSHSRTSAPTLLKVLVGKVVKCKTRMQQSDSKPWRRQMIQLHHWRLVFYFSATQIWMNDWPATMWSVDWIPPHREEVQEVRRSLFCSLVGFPPGTQVQLQRHQRVSALQAWMEYIEIHPPDSLQVVLQNYLQHHRRRGLKQHINNVFYNMQHAAWPCKESPTPCDVAKWTSLWTEQFYSTMQQY